MTPDPSSQPLVRSARLGSRIDRFLFPWPAERQVGAILRWWEARRLPYNLTVGASGAAALTVIAITCALPPNPIPFDVTISAIVVYGALANVCYTLGAAVEITFHKLWGSEVLPVGPALFRAGLTLSVGLTLFVPVVLAVVIWVVRVVCLVV